MNKYRVLIIDDERLIREGLKSYIDWSALNAEVVAICADGREGVQAIETHHPHIVLTDVSMPNMDGIALLKYVREKHIACEFILISSYSEFRYAQEALKLGAFDYILKPIEPDALYACVKRCVEKVEKTPAPSSAMPLSPEIMTEWLRNVLVAVPAAESALQRMLGMAGLDTDALALLVAVDPAQVLLPNDGLPFATALSAHITVFLCRDDASARATAQLCKTEHFRILPLSGDIYLRFNAALYELWEAQHTLSPVAGEGLPPPSVVNALDIQGMQRHLHGALRAICGRPEQTLLTVRSRLNEYFRAFYHQLEERFHSPLPNAPSVEKCLEELLWCNNLYDLMQTLEAQAVNLYSLLSAQPAYTAYVRKAIRIIHEEYSTPLSLSGVAARLNVSPSYFSTLFKANTGYAFSDYLFRYRMSIARDLLHAGEYKVYEISAMVGYPDVVQFSKRFKQFFTLSPREMMNHPENDPDPTPHGQENKY